MEGRLVMVVQHPECDRLLVAALPEPCARRDSRNGLQRNGSNQGKAMQTGMEQSPQRDITPAHVSENRHTTTDRKAPAAMFTEFPPQRAHYTPHQGNFVTGVRESVQVQPGEVHSFPRRDPAYPTHGLVYCVSAHTEKFARLLRQSRVGARPLGAHSRELLARLTSRDPRSILRKTMGKKSIHSLPEKKKLQKVNLKNQPAAGGNKPTYTAAERESKSAGTARNKDSKIGEEDGSSAKRRGRSKWSKVKKPTEELAAQFHYLPRPESLVTPVLTALNIPVLTSSPTPSPIPVRSSPPGHIGPTTPVLSRTPDLSRTPVRTSTRTRTFTPVRTSTPTSARSPARTPPPASRPTSARTHVSVRDPAVYRGTTSTGTRMHAGCRGTTYTREPDRTVTAATSSPWRGEHCQKENMIRQLYQLNPHCVVAADRKNKVAFVAPSGSLQYCRMRVALKNTSRFQRLRDRFRNGLKNVTTVFQMLPSLRTCSTRHKQTCVLKECDSDVSIEREYEGSALPFCRLWQYFNTETDQLSKEPKPSQGSRYCPCRKTSKCTCRPWQSYRRCVWYPAVSPFLCQCKKNEDVYYSNKVYEAVSKWLNSIPVPPNECPENNNLRIELAEDLVAEILQLPADDDFENNVSAAIQKCIDQIPMWIPDSKYDQYHLKKQLLESLFNDIIDIPRHPNMLREVIRNFINSLSFADDDVDKKAIVDDIVKDLKLLGAYIYYASFTDLLKSVIVKKLDEIPFEFDGDRDMVLHSYAKKLANDVENILKHPDRVDDDEEEDHRKDLENKNKKAIAAWLSDIRDKLPNDVDIKNLERDLITKLKKYYSEGVTEKARNDMENEINTTLQNLELDTPTKEKIVTSLMSKLTDNILADDKKKLNEDLYKKTFGELNKWMKQIRGIKDLDELKQYKIVKDLTDKITNNERKGTPDYRNDIIESLQNAGFDGGPDSIQQELDDIVYKIRALPQQVHKDDLKKGIRKELTNAITNNPNIPKDSNLVHELNDVLSQIMNTSPMGTQKDIETAKEKLLEQLIERLNSTPMSENRKAPIREELANILDKKFENWTEKRAKNKDAAKRLLQKEVSFALNQEPMSENVKDDLKLTIKDLIEEKLSRPFSHSIIETINDEIENIMNEIEGLEDKPKMTEKLKRIVNNLEDLPQETLTEHTMNELIKSIKAEIDKRNMLDDDINDLKKLADNIIKNNFRQPYDSQVKLDILENMNGAIEKSLLPEEEKESLMNMMTKIVTEYLDPLPNQTENDYTKDAINKEIYEIRAEIPLQSAELKKYMADIKAAISEALDRPYTEQGKLKLYKQIQDTTDKTNIPSDKKSNVTNKVVDIVNHHLDNLPYQTNSFYAKNELITNLHNALKNLQLDKEEKQKLKESLDEKIEEIIGDDLRKNKELLGEAIEEIIRQSAITQSKQDVLLNNFKDDSNKILEKSFYPDDVMRYVREQDKKINKSRLDENEKRDLMSTLRKKIDDISQDSDFFYKTDDIEGELGLNQLPLGPQDTDIKRKIQKLRSAVKSAPLPANKKNMLLNKINEKPDDALDDQDINELVNDLQRLIEELPSSSTDKKGLALKIEMIANPKSEEVQKKVKTNLMNDMDTAVNQIPLPEEKKKNVLDELRDLLASVSKVTTTDHKNRIKEGAHRVIDKNVFSKDKNLELKNRLGDIIDNLPSYESDAKDELKSVASRTINEGGFRPDVADDLKSQLKYVISQLLDRPYEVNAKANAIKDIKDIINKSGLTEQEKRTLEPKMVENMKRKIDKLSDGTYVGGNVGSPMFKQVKKAVDEASIPNEQKRAINRRMKQIASEADLIGGEKERLKQDFLKILSNTNLSPVQKAELSERIENEMNKFKEPTVSKIGLMNTIMEDVHKHIDENDAIPPHLKKQLKQDIQEALVDRVAQQLSPEDLVDELKSGISEIINKSPVVKSQKKELKTNLKKSVADNIERQVGKEKLTDEAIEDNYQVTTNKKKEPITVIEEWMDKLPINMPKQNKDALLKDIEEDIRDRQEYLRMFPNAKKSSEEELEDIQYQVIRKLKKGLDDEDMARVMKETNSLVKRLKEETMPGRTIGSSPMDRSTFNTMKEELADAFFDLNFTGGTLEEREDAKQKIANQVYKFCDDYLEAHPDESMDYETLRLKLYEMLQKTLLPSDDSETECYQQTPQEVIADLMSTLPPLDHLSCVERKQLEREEIRLENELREIDKNEAGLTRDQIEKEKMLATTKFKKRVLCIIHGCPSKLRAPEYCPGSTKSYVCPPPRICPGRRPPLCSAPERRMFNCRQRTSKKPLCPAPFRRVCVSGPTRAFDTKSSQTDLLLPGIQRQECPYLPYTSRPRLVSTPSNTEQSMMNSCIQGPRCTDIAPEVRLKHSWVPEPECSVVPPCRMTLPSARCGYPARRMHRLPDPPDGPRSVSRDICPPDTCPRSFRPGTHKSTVNLTFQPPTHSTPKPSFISYLEDCNYTRPKVNDLPRFEFRSTIPSRHVDRALLLKLNDKLLRCESAWSPAMSDEDAWPEPVRDPSPRRLRLRDYSAPRPYYLDHSPCKKHSGSSASFSDEQEDLIHCPYPSEGFFK